MECIWDDQAHRDNEAKKLPTIMSFWTFEQI